MTLLAAWVAGLTLVSAQFSSAYEVGDRPPSFQAETLDGAKIKLSDLKGSVVVLNFWFIACPPCLEEMPDLNRLVDEFAADDVVFLAITPVDTPKDLAKFLKKHKFKYQIVAEAWDLMESYGVTGAPTHMIIDQEGRIHSILFGAVTDLEEQMARPIRGLLKPETVQSS